VSCAVHRGDRGHAENELGDDILVGPAYGDQPQADTNTYVARVGL
jgi:hypothetical protein